MDLLSNWQSLTTLFNSLFSTFKLNARCRMSVVTVQFNRDIHTPTCVSHSCLFTQSLHILSRPKALQRASPSRRPFWTFQPSLFSWYHADGLFLIVWCASAPACHVYCLSTAWLINYLSVFTFSTFSLLFITQQWNMSN